MGSVDGISGNSTHDLEATVDTDGEPHDANIEFEQLKLLFDYTKFHIGLYTTIATILVRYSRRVTKPQSVSAPYFSCAPLCWCA